MVSYGYILMYLTKSDLLKRPLNLFQTIKNAQLKTNKQKKPESLGMKGHLLLSFCKAFILLSY